MSETAVEVLERWEAHGALWRLCWRSEKEAVVDLCACTGELMDQVRSADPELLAYLDRRRSSEDD
ncbi:hypothetical protein FSW04_12245 [Baekduia soli]|uniref:Uncharacterized protein n=1 Tax=Baekduia soli TaxID=496014 RepID=A0A5B8U5F9_9ACTN|nr:hypothetical protein [Baekduia soli]QEC48260.1 hypothetical protein FSW04_12245 [Baekduia soli]